MKVSGQFTDIAEHIIKTEGIGSQKTNSMQSTLAVIQTPTKYRNFCNIIGIGSIWIYTAIIHSLCACAAGILPLRFCGDIEIKSRKFCANAPKRTT